MKGFWTIGKKIIGGILIVGGVLGLFLPFLQGVAMIIAGAVLLGNKHIADCGKWIKSTYRRLIARFKRG
jgi:hypothetical protein